MLKNLIIPNKAPGIIFLFVFSLTLFSFSQESTDSLKNLLPGSEQQIKVEILQELSQQYYEKSSDSCLVYAFQAIDIATKLNNNAQKANSYRIIGKFYDKKRDNYPQSIVYNDSALIYYLKDKDYYNSTKTQILIADLYDLISDYQDAIAYLNNAHKSCDSLINSYPDTNAIKSMYADIFTGKGLVYRKLDSSRLSMQYMNKALDYSMQINDSISIAGTYCNIASIYQAKKENISAVSKYKEATKYMQNEGFDEHRASIYTNMGGILEYEGEVDSAFCYFRKAEPLFIKTGNKYNLSILYTCYGTAYLNLENYTKALEYYSKALKIANEIDAGKLSYYCYNMLSEIYVKLGNTTKALEYYKKYTNLKDSIVGKETRENISNLEIKYETEKKEKENLGLKQKIELKDIVLKQKNKEIITYIIVILVVIGFLLYILVLLRNKSKSYDAIVRQNIRSLEIEKKLEQTMAISKKYDIQQLPDSEKGLLELDKKLTQFMLEEKPYLWKEINLEEFCHKLNTNRTYLSKLINEKYGQSFQDFISENRIRTARELLINPELQHISIEGIGEMSGFKSNTNFHKRFKDLVQLTPKQFRDIALKNKN